MADVPFVLQVNLISERSVKFCPQTGKLFYIFSCTLVISAIAWIKFLVSIPGFEVIKLEFILRLKIKRNDWLLVDTCPQAANHCA